MCMCVHNIILLTYNIIFSINELTILNNPFEYNTMNIHLVLSNTSHKCLT